MMPHQRNVLFITYNGLLEPITQAQALPYLRRIAQADRSIVILSFEKPHDLRRVGRQRLRRRREELASERIIWRWLRYHKHPSVPATLYDIGRGMLTGWYLAARHACRIIHARGTVAAAMGRWAAKALRRKFLFDLRGLMAEEYADGGLWKRNGWRFRLVNRLERRMLTTADAVVVLTERIRDVLSRNGWGRRSLPPITVIPCCVDVDRFRPRQRDAALASRFGLEDAFVVMYVGSLGTWYLLDEMLDWFTIFRRRQSRSRLLIVTQTDSAVAERAIAAHQLTGQVVVTSGAPEEMPRYWSLADAAISFILPAFSKLASSPTRVGEALASGVPLVINRGVGDLDALVEQYRCGVIVEGFTPEAYESAIGALLRLLPDDGLRQRCRRAAEERLALSQGAQRYAQLYQQLISTPSSDPNHA